MLPSFYIMKLCGACRTPMQPVQAVQPRLHADSSLGTMGDSFVRFEFGSHLTKGVLVTGAHRLTIGIKVRARGPRIR